MTRTLPKIAEDDPKISETHLRSSKDFRTWSEGQQVFLIVSRRLPKTTRCLYHTNLALYVITYTNLFIADTLISNASSRSWRERKCNNYANQGGKRGGIGERASNFCSKINCGKYNAVLVVDLYYWVCFLWNYHHFPYQHSIPLVHHWCKKDLMNHVSWNIALPTSVR